MRRLFKTRHFKQARGGKLTVNKQAKKKVN